MSQVTMSARTIQWLGVGIPLLALLLTLGVVYPGWGRYQHLTGRVREQRAQLRDLRSAPLPPPDPVLPAAEDVESEPAQFLGTIAATLSASQCELTGLDVEPPATGPADSLVRPVRTRVAFKTHYTHLRSLLVQLSRSTRLYAVRELEAKPEAADSQDQLAARRLEVGVSIERYVTKPAVAAASASLP